VSPRARLPACRRAVLQPSRDPFSAWEPMELSVSVPDHRRAAGSKSGRRPAVARYLVQLARGGSQPNRRRPKALRSATRAKFHAQMRPSRPPRRHSAARFPTQLPPQWSWTRCRAAATTSRPRRRHTTPNDPGAGPGSSKNGMERRGRQGHSVPAHAPEAIAAVDGLAVRGLEGHFGGAAATAAGGREHLPRAAIRACARPIGAAPAPDAAVGSSRLSRVTAGAAPLGLRKPPLGVEVLLARCEYELLAAVGADQNLVRVHGNLELLSVAVPCLHVTLRRPGSRFLDTLAASPRALRRDCTSVTPACIDVRRIRSSTPTSGGTCT
jgi:hypothetical protein